MSSLPGPSFHLMLRTPFQGTLWTSVWTGQSPRQRICSPLLYFNLIISWSLKQSTSPTSPSLFANSRSVRPLSQQAHIWSQELIFHSLRNLLDCPLSAVLNFQQTSMKINSPMRARASTDVTSVSHLCGILHLPLHSGCVVCNRLPPVPLPSPWILPIATQPCHLSPWALCSGTLPDVQSHSTAVPTGEPL